MVDLKPTAPSEFQRQPRSLKYWRQWNTTELRQFLLYTGPVVLKNIIKEDVYLNFLSLHLAIAIFSRNEYTQNDKYLEYANSLLKSFVETFEIKYGKEYISHNVHNLLHILNDVRRYGSLDKYSAFGFESYLFQIKKKVRKGARPLQQLAKRYVEGLSSCLNPPGSDC